MNTTIDRRNFLKQSAVLGAGLAAWRVGMPVRAADSANSKIVLAVIGTNARGLAHINGLMAQPNIEIAYICDVDDRSIAKGLKAVAAKGGKEPKGAKDLRRMLEDKTLDAVTIATRCRADLRARKVRVVTGCSDPACEWTLMAPSFPITPSQPCRVQAVPTRNTRSREAGVASIASVPSGPAAPRRLVTDP